MYLIYISFLVQFWDLYGCYALCSITIQLHALRLGNSKKGSGDHNEGMGNNGQIL